MTTYLLAWNPKRWSWEPSPKDLSRKANRTQAGAAVADTWSLGRSRKPQPGDRFFLIKLGSAPKGIFGAGYFTGRPYRGPHYGVSGKHSMYARIRYDYLVDGYQTVVIPREELDTGVLSRQHWDTQMSGIAIRSDVAAQLETLWAERIGIVNGTPIGEEISGPVSFVEGGRLSVQVNRYERDPAARIACVEHYGMKCSVCDLELASRYGKIAAGFIHVHHLKPLATIGKKYAVDPIHDLRPVCPNCHAIIHRRVPAYSIAEVRRFLAGASQ